MPLPAACGNDLGGTVDGLDNECMDLLANRYGYDSENNGEDENDSDENAVEGIQENSESEESDGQPEQREVEEPEGKSTTFPLEIGNRFRSNVRLGTCSSHSCGWRKNKYKTSVGEKGNKGKGAQKNKGDEKKEEGWGESDVRCQGRVAWVTEIACVEKCALR